MKTAFVCNKDTFAHIYKLEKRRSEREWPSSYLFYIKVDSTNKENLKKVSSRMMEVLSKKLRSGDAVCRWDDNHFALILYDIKKSDTTGVIDRIYSHCFENNLKFDIDIDIDCQLVV